MYVIGTLEFLASPGKDKTDFTVTLDIGRTEDYTIYNTIIPQTLKVSIKLFRRTIKFYTYIRYIYNYV